MINKSAKGLVMQGRAAELLEGLGYITYRKPRFTKTEDAFDWVDIFVLDSPRYSSQFKWHWKDYFGEITFVQVKSRQNFSWRDMEAKAKKFPRIARVILMLWDRSEEGFKVFVWRASNRKFTKIDRILGDTQQIWQE